jgi:hypothetical protein
MIRKCKGDIEEFGFTGKKYTQFLISVEAMKDENTVLKFPNRQLSDYREKYLKQSEYEVGDSLILDKFKIMTSETNGHQYETGYFSPRSFWDKILNSEVNL